MSNFSLEGKTALLTGAAGFFGHHFAHALLEAGADVILTDRKAEEISHFGAELKKRYKSRRVIWVVVDQYDRERSQRVFRSLADDHQVDILINNSWDFSTRTGMNTPDGRLETATYEQLRSSFESGIYWAVETTQIFGLKMKERGWGSIINIGSMYSVIVPAPDLYEGTDTFNAPGYSLAKAGLVQFTKYSAAHLAPEVRVNAISPGTFPNLEMEGPNAITKDNPVIQRLLKKVLLGRMGHPRELAGALVFLASEAASYVTGQNLIIDGGLTIT